MPQHSRTFPGFLSAIDGWMRMQMLATPFSNLLHRIGGDYRGGIAQPGWRTFMMICLHWNLEYMRLEIWCKIGLSADWCLCTALHTHSGACCYWIGFDRCQAEVWQCMKKWCRGSYNYHSVEAEWCHFPEYTFCRKCNILNINYEFSLDDAAITSLTSNKYSDFALKSSPFTYPGKQPLNRDCFVLSTDKRDNNYIKQKATI